MTPLLAADAGFAARIAARFPAQPLRTFVLDRTEIGNLRFGIAVIALRELLEEPFISAIPELRPLETLTCQRHAAREIVDTLIPPPIASPSPSIKTAQLRRRGARS